MTRPAIRPRLRLLLALLPALLAAASCTTSSGGDPRTDSQTHWLLPCGDGAPCADGLACLCGVCTTACEDAAACGDLRADAVCAASGDASFSATCPGDAPPICLPACADDAACGDGFACTDGACTPRRNACPVHNRPECAQGQALVTRYDADGCPYPACEDVANSVECPVINLPVCPDGQQVVQGTDPNGCPTLTCQPNECPPVAAPDLNFCDPGQRIVQTEGPNGCPDWACTFEGCPDFDFPDMCFDGQPPSMRELGPNGCIVLTCAAERSFPCGDNLACSFDTEYCDVFVPGDQGGQTSYTCAPLPDTCLAEPSCACLADAGAWSENTGDCQDGGGPPGSATLTVTTFAP